MSTFKVGERVFSYSRQEWGTIDDVCINPYNIVVQFDMGYESIYLSNGRKGITDKAPDLFYNEVSIAPPPKPLQDKDIVLCWDNKVSLMSITFYDAINKCTFNALGSRKGMRYDNMLLMENPPQYMLDIKSKLDD